MITYQMKRSLFFSTILSIILCCCSIEKAYSQADAGEDKITCKGTGVTIGGTGDPSWCYNWTPTTGLSDPHILNPTATPNTKTVYKLKVVGPNFSFTEEDEMTVFVAEKVKLEVENNITQCMENREVTFTATIEGADLPATLPEPVEFIFHYTRADGSTWTGNEWSSSLTQDHTAMADKVPDGDPDHKFTTPIYAEVKFKTCTLTPSNTVNIDVHELWIDYVRFSAAKPWKVVVGEPFAYNAIASSDTKNWEWDMEDGFPDMWNPAGGNAKTGTMTIPDSDLPDDDEWNDFGETYGTVNAFCEDGEDNNHEIASTDLIPSMKVKVFFDGVLTTNPGGTDKNWFYYWKYALFGNISTVSYDPSIVYGSTNTSGVTIGDNTNADYATAYNHTAMFGYPRPTADGKSRIDLFYSVTTHELQHLVDIPFLGVGTDTDGDLLPDSRDPFPAVLNGAGFVEYTGANAWRGDWEHKARAVEGVVAPAAKDWSKLGKQW